MDDMTQDAALVTAVTDTDHANACAFLERVKDEDWSLDWLVANVIAEHRLAASDHPDERGGEALREALRRIREQDFWTEGDEPDEVDGQCAAIARQALDDESPDETPSLRRTITILRRALAWHGDRQRMATTREEWQQEIDAALVWVMENPEPGLPSFPTLADALLSPAALSTPAAPEPTEAGEWRGMESAPNDGTKIDLWCMSDPAYRVTDAYWQGSAKKGWWWAAGRDYEGADGSMDGEMPVRWRYPPAPPAVLAARPSLPGGMPA